MKAIGIRKGSKKPETFEIEIPKIKKPTQALLEITNVGICGTDKDLIENSMVDPPQGEDKLILGHEGIGKVIETGTEVKGLKKGDYAILIPRHGCGICKPCNLERADFCETGKYTAAGQHKLHGYNSEYYVEDEKYMVKAPKKIADVAVLTEPFSVIEKALSQAEHIQKRIPGYNLKQKKAIVFGLGSVGMSAIATLRSKGIETYALGRRDEQDPRAKIITELGAKYIDIRNKNVMTIKEETGEADLIIEATGATQLVIDLIELMGKNAAYIFLGIPKGAEELCFNIKGMINKIVRGNYIIMGSVNSQKQHFKQALKTIDKIQKKSKILNKIITHKYTIDQYEKAFQKDGEDAIKAIIDYTKRN